MLTVVSGPFHPGLEQDFLDRIADLKKDPMAPVAVVAPSSRLVERLQLALTGTGHAYLNIHFHTFASLAEKIVETGEPLKKPILSDPLFFDTLVKQIVRDDKPFDIFEDLAVPDGFPPAVRGTLRDLLDAGINQDNVDALIQEGFAGKDVDLGSLRSLLHLHRLYLRRIEKVSVLPRSELLRRAIDLAPASKTLKEFKEVIYYGFYDLTGLQADFFQAVVKNFPSRFYFPYVRDNAAYAFAKQFRDTFVQPVMREEIVLDAEKKDVPTRILNVSGLRDEAWFTANEIRRLHDEEGVPFSEIGVIARTKERLGFLVQEALLDRGIPCRNALFPTKADFPAVQDLLKRLEKKHAPEETSTWTKYSEEVAADGVESLAKFDEINEEVAWESFVETVRDRFARTEVRDPKAGDAGVALLYAEAARGLPFKVVFLVGLEEKVFPRIVREDPFLRDDAREALNGIGHKISKKMTALDEERLMFELFVTAPSQRLYLLHQRSDDEGGVVGTSPFLRVFAEERKIALDNPVDSLPRPLLEKIKHASPSVLGVRDLVTGFLAAQKTAEAFRFAGDIGRDRPGLERGLQLQKAIHRFDAPGAYDTQLGKMGTADIFRHGTISPTALESYARCRFQFFARGMLDLVPLETDAMEEAIAATLRGKQAHAFVELFFRTVTEEGKKAPPAQLSQSVFDALFDTAVPAAPLAESKLPPVLWQAIRANMRAMLSAFLADELARLAQEGARPEMFEVEMAGRLPAPLDEFQWTGKIDRVDAVGGSVRVIDYKTGSPFKGKKVSDLAVKGEKLQAPIYLLLARQFLERLGRKASDLSFVYEFIDHVGEQRTMGAEEFALHSQTMLAVVRTLVDSAHQGDFLMVPGRHCAYCEVAQACRANHGISVYRADRANGKAS